MRSWGRTFQLGYAKGRVDVRRVEGVQVGGRHLCRSLKKAWGTWSFEGVMDRLDDPRPQAPAREPVIGQRHRPHGRAIKMQMLWCVAVVVLRRNSVARDGAGIFTSIFCALTE